MTRIIFNGQEYPSREAMPEDVRRAYDAALGILRENHPGSADAAAGDHTVIDMQHRTSFTLGGPGGVRLPPGMGRLVASALDRASGADDSRDEPAADEPVHTAFGMVLAFAAGFVFVLGLMLMVALGGGRSHLPGRLMVAVATLLLLGWLDGMATRMVRRREAPLGWDSPYYRRFIKWSAAAMATAAVVLLGVAWYLP